MTEYIVGIDDIVTLGMYGQAVIRVVSIGGVQVEGIPYATDFRPPMLNVDKAWYSAVERYGSYAGHPPATDWNLESGGNTDLGEPLVAPFSGTVLTATQLGGSVGRVVQIMGVFPGGGMVVWMGWHLQEYQVSAGQGVDIGDGIGTIGNADGRYKGAHLHEQICYVGEGDYGIPTPRTFTSDSRYRWVSGPVFYVEHGVDSDLIEHLTKWDKQ